MMNYSHAHIGATVAAGGQGFSTVSADGEAHAERRDTSNLAVGLDGENDVLICGTVTGELLFVNCQTLTILHRRPVHSYDPITSIALSPGDHHIFVSTASGNVAVLSRHQEYLRGRVITQFKKAAIV